MVRLVIDNDARLFEGGLLKLWHPMDSRRRAGAKTARIAAFLLLHSLPILFMVFVYPSS